MTAAIRTAASLKAQFADIIAGMGRCALINNKTSVVTSAACQIRRVAPPLPATVATMMLTAPWGQPLRVHCLQHRVVPTVAQRP
jgi:hypothetical protein